MAGGNFYTEEELKVVMDPYLTGREVSRKIGRTIGAVNAKRRLMQYKSAKVSNTGKNRDIFPSNVTTKPIPSWPYNMLIKAYIIDGEEPLSDEQFAGLHKAMECFTARETAAIRLYFVEGIPLEECGHEMGITRERVRQIIAKALRKLRHPTRANLIVYGEDIRNHNHYLEHLREVKEEIKALEAFIEEHKETCDFVQESHSFMEKIPHDPGDISLDEMDLSIRSYNCLKRRGVRSASEVANLVNSGEIMKVRNLGVKSYTEIINKLKDLGYKMEVTA